MADILAAALALTTLAAAGIAVAYMRAARHYRAALLRMPPQGPR